MVRAGDRVMAFQHRGYWNSLPTVEDYWRAHMDLVSESPLLNLVEGQWPVRTQAEIRPSTRISVGARVSSSILCEGCVVEGAVEHSILSPGVHVAPGAIVRNAVVLHDVTIEGGAVVENAVLDMNVTVGSQARVGWPEGRAGTSGVFPAREISVVERGVHIPAHVVIEPDGPHPAWLLFARPAGVSELRVSAVG
jgi:glucose-1-phosphate adenylyltransferase